MGLNLVCRESGEREGWQRIEVEAFLALNLLGQDVSWQDMAAVGRIRWQCAEEGGQCVEKKKAAGRKG